MGEEGRKEVIIRRYCRRCDIIYLSVRGKKQDKPYSEETHPYEYKVRLLLSSEYKVISMSIIWFKKFALKYVAQNFLDRFFISLFGGRFIPKKKIEKAYYDVVATSGYQSW